MERLLIKEHEVGFMASSILRSIAWTLEPDRPHPWQGMKWGPPSQRIPPPKAADACLDRTKAGQSIPLS
jgi:hypothetical protein